MNQNTTIPTKDVSFDPFAGPVISSVICTTEAQLEIWTSCQLGGADANRAYNESISLQLTGTVVPDAFQRSFNTVVLRHESLRAVFSTDGRYMSIFETMPGTLDRKDFSNLPLQDRHEAVATYLKEYANHIFDLVNGPLFKIGLIRLSETEHRLVITAHHIICDGWSLGILLQELGSFYSAYLKNIPAELKVPNSFIDYADNQQILTDTKEYDAIEQFWIQQFEPTYSGLTLPTDFSRPSQRTFESHRLDFPLDKNMLDALKKTGIAAGCSLVTTLLAAFEVFLYRTTGQDDIVVGLPTAGQSVTGMHQLIGHCVNLLPLRSRLQTDLPFVEYLKQRKSDLFDAYDHQQLSFGQLLQKLFVSRDTSRVPLVPVVFNIDLGLADGVSFAGLSYDLISDPRHYETFELFLNASGTEDHLLLEWSYNTALFKPETIDTMMASFKEVLERVIENPNGTLDYIARIDTGAYTALNATQAPYPDIPLHRLLADGALQFHDRKALKFGGTSMRYGAFHEQVNRLAHHLSAQGVQKGDFIAVAIPRCAELPVVLLAILQCGAAYLPLDPNYPKQRLEFMLSDAQARFLITTKAVKSSFKTTYESLFLEDMFRGLHQYPSNMLSVEVDTQDTAYLLYTSGSTGKPKGVAVSHKNIVNFLCSMAIEPGIEATDVLLSITTISFDISGLELFLPLLKGAELIIADSATARDGRLLMDTLKTEGITILQATPTTWQMLLESGWDAKLSIKALCGGEALTLTLAHKILQRCDQLWNMYGPTETTVWSAIKQIRADDETITIGKPIANTQLYIVNENDQLMTPGAIGEIAIGGDGVSKGYWKRPDLSAEKFKSSLFAAEKNQLLYRTGDLGILLSSGEVQCLGRTDQQVKIRGHRIELGEIEKALTDLEDVRSAVVMAHGERLIAHIIPNMPIETAEKRAPQWREILADRLPENLRPQEYRMLLEMPVTPNGKLNRKALLETKVEDQRHQGILQSPRSTTEKLVAATWKKHLALDKIDIFDNFFELGGYSLIALRIMLDLEKETGKRLPLSALFDYSTVEKLSQLLDGDSDLVSSETLVPIQPNGSKTPLFLIHGVGLTALKFKGLVDNLDDDQPVYGLQGKGDIEDIEESSISVEEIAAHYIEHIRMVDPFGPYALAGHSYGGVIIYEIARQLLEQGQEIKRLIMLDSYVEPFFYYSDPFRKEIAVAQYHVGRILSRVKHFITNWENIPLFFNRRKQALLQRFSDPKDEQDAQSRADDQHNRRVDDMNHLIVKPYQMVPQHFCIDLIRAENNVYYMHDPEYFGWKDLALNGMNVHDVPGNHFDMFTSANGEVTAGILQSVLDNNY